ncbi:MAG: InlB B-repeat-containing protein [Treponema sp.]|nr:InlB B-repeat-containing protein [Treponema sp.]
MKNTRTVQRAISVFAVIAFIGFALSSCGGNGSPVAPPPLDEFTVTFVTGGGTVMSPVQVQDGDLVPSQPNPVRAFTPGAGLWSDDPFALFDTFVEWQHNGTAWDLATDTVTADMTLTAVWTAPAPIEAPGANVVAAAVAHVNANPGVFTLLINANVDLGGVVATLNAEDADLTIIGLGGAREITRTGNGATLTVTGGAGRRLTIGNNITLPGRDQTGSVVTVVGGAEFVMLDGSLITGNDTSSGNGAVNVTGDSTFTMRGGSITGNTSTNTTSNAAGGVFVNNDAVFAMHGGSVSGNTGAWGDVLVQTAGDIFLSGSAEIGTLQLTANATANASVTIETGWAGSITGGLNLRGAWPSLTPTIDWWAGNTVLEGPGFTAALVGQFPLGDFLSNQTDADGHVRQRIADTHMIDEDGVLVELLP